MPVFRTIACLVTLFLAPLAARAEEPPPAGAAAIERYAATLDGERRAAAAFLLEHLPATDRDGLPVALFRENLELAFSAREQYPWTRRLPRELFFNDVLPHAVADETRDPWRRQLRDLFAPHLADCTNVCEVAAAVGSRIATLTGVHYDTRREKACQSPAESMRTGKASCTGLSILMVDALRAVGVPARLVTIPLWGTREGNHTWVEIHDGDGWQASDFGGSPSGWNKGWAVARCAYCDPAQPVHCVFASSYRPTGLELPTAWSWDFRRARSLRTIDDLCRQTRNEQGQLLLLQWRFQWSYTPAVDRTAHYLKLAGGRQVPIPRGMACVAVRAYRVGAKERIAVPIRLRLDGKELFAGRTADETRDLNDYVRVICSPGPVQVEYQNADGTWTTIPAEARADRETPVKIERPLPP